MHAETGYISSCIQGMHHKRLRPEELDTLEVLQVLEDLFGFPFVAILELLTGTRLPSPSSQGSAKSTSLRGTPWVSRDLPVFWTELELFGRTGAVGREVLWLGSLAVICIQRLHAQCVLGHTRAHFTCRRDVTQKYPSSFPDPSLLPTITHTTTTQKHSPPHTTTHHHINTTQTPHTTTHNNTQQHTQTQRTHNAHTTHNNTQHTKTHKNTTTNNQQTHNKHTHHLARTTTTTTTTHHTPPHTTTHNHTQPHTTTHTTHTAHTQHTQTQHTPHTRNAHNAQQHTKKHTKTHNNTKTHKKHKHTPPPPHHHHTTTKTTTNTTTQVLTPALAPTGWHPCLVHRSGFCHTFWSSLETSLLGCLLSTLLCRRWWTSWWKCRCCKEYISNYRNLATKTVYLQHEQQYEQ